ncbi:MAG: type VI secretion system domain-containing protein, partial [bacterium]
QAAAASDGRRGSRHDVRSMARNQIRAGNPQKAIRLLLDAASREDSARERFLRRSEATQIMVSQGMESVALPILRQMMDQVERHELEEWEAGETVARTMALLYQCMDRLGEDPGLKEELYLRICRLDPMQGMSLEAGGGEGEEAQAETAAAEEADGDAGEG